jgi:hypothetical protein
MLANVDETATFETDRGEIGLRFDGHRPERSGHLCFRLDSHFVLVEVERDTNMARNDDDIARNKTTVHGSYMSMPSACRSGATLEMGSSRQRVPSSVLPTFPS